MTTTPLDRAANVGKSALQVAVIVTGASILGPVLGPPILIGAGLGVGRYILLGPPPKAEADHWRPGR